LDLKLGLLGGHRDPGASEFGSMLANLGLQRFEALHHFLDLAVDIVCGHELRGEQQARHRNGSRP